MYVSTIFNISMNIWVASLYGFYGFFMGFRDLSNPRDFGIARPSQGDDDSLTQDFLRFLAQADRSGGPADGVGTQSHQEESLAGYRHEILMEI